MPEEIKVGDIMMVSDGGYGTHYILAKVTRIMKSVIETDDGRKWRKEKRDPFAEQGWNISPRLEGWKRNINIYSYTEKQQKRYEEWNEDEDKKTIWRRILSLKLPHKIGNGRLIKIYKELELGSQE